MIGMGVERKVTSSHLQRLAVLYVRQSTLAQVRFNRESAERQYALADEAARLRRVGGSMTTLHRRVGSYYECGHSRADNINTPACRSVKTVVVDELVARCVLEAVAPEEIALALAAADEVTDRRTRHSARSPDRPPDPPAAGADRGGCRSPRAAAR